jgi:cyclic pyranopterin monophosphate synthase
MEKRLNHFNKNGEVHMVDVGEKPFSSRVAIAKGEISMAQTTLKVICDGLANKGDVLGTARLAGIMAAKNTSSLIPLCHPIHITKVSLDLLPNKKEKKIEIIASVRSSGQTGVEMEALTAVNIAALTIYDMVKAIDKGMKINNIRLTLKDGGKSGKFESK